MADAERTDAEPADAGLTDAGTWDAGIREAGSNAGMRAVAARDLADVPAAEVIAATAVHLMSAAAVKCGLAPDGLAERDLDEARKLITALAGLLAAVRPDLGIHAAPLRDGLQSLQRAFREASTLPDAPGEGPGERLNGPGH